MQTKFFTEKEIRTAAIAKFTLEIKEEATRLAVSLSPTPEQIRTWSAAIFDKAEKLMVLELSLKEEK